MKTTGADGTALERGQSLRQDLEEPLSFVNFRHTRGLGESQSEPVENQPEWVREVRRRGHSVEKQTVDALRGARQNGRLLSNDTIDPDQRRQLEMSRRHGWSVPGLWGWAKHIVEALFTSSAQLYYERAEVVAVRDVMLTGNADAVLQLLQNTEGDMKAMGTGDAFSVPQETEIKTCWQRTRGLRHSRSQLFENRTLAKYMEARVRHVKNSPASFIFEASWKAQESKQWHEAVPTQWNQPQQGGNESSTPQMQPQPEPELAAGGWVSREIPPTSDDPSMLVSSLINRYGRASPDKAMVRLGTEIARLNYLIDTKYDINMKLTAAAFSLMFLFGQRHSDNCSGSVS